MKHLRHIFTALLLLCATTVAAHDFAVDGIYYNITATNKKVEVTYRGDSYDDYSNEYAGSEVIPESVTYNGKTYSVTSIGFYAFRDCTGLTGVVIPNSVTSIGYDAFEGCSGLTSVEIGNSVTTIGVYAFYGCSGLTSIEIPNSVRSIGSSAFSSCSGLTSVEIPNSVTSIGNYAFSGCTGLTSIEIPNSVTSIGNYAFSGCSGLTAVHIRDFSAWCNIDFGNSAANPLSLAKNLYLNGELLTELVIPDGVEELKFGAFYGCTSLKNVTIPNSVTSIGSSAFSSCSGLTSVEIGNSVTSIGYSAFYGCSGLEYVTIPDGVKTIGQSAFNGCSSVEELYISSTIESIGDYAFAECNNILDIKIGSKKAITASENIFSSDAYNNACLYVPTGKKIAYEKATPWNNFYIAEMDFTGIDEVFDEVKTENGNVKTVYDLNGRAVENPSNGIYIVGGKKVLVK